MESYLLDTNIKILALFRNIFLIDAQKFKLVTSACKVSKFSVTWFSVLIYDISVNYQFLFGMEGTMTD